MRAGASTRLTALDVLRGLAVSGMILVVSPGDWSQVYAPLQHAAWNGWTLADMVFPTFLFSVGAALGLSFPRAWDDARHRRSFWFKLARRVVALIILGVLVEATYVGATAINAPYPDGALAHVRIPGILQRIGLCYGLAAILCVVTAVRPSDGTLALRPARLALAAAAILVGYWLLLMLVPVPGVGAGHLDPAGNLGAYIDRSVFGVAHLWPLGQANAGGPVVYDPEGLLSSLPATANVLLGAGATTILRSDPRRGLATLLVGGLLLFVAGNLLDPLFVINKRIWTSSFALVSTGFSAVLLGLLILVLRSAEIDRLLRPLQVLGGNAILAFLLSTLMSRIAGFSFVPEGAGWATPQQWGFHLAARIVPDPRLASLLCAFGIVVLVTAVLFPLHRRALHFRL